MISGFLGFSKTRDFLSRLETDFAHASADLFLDLFTYLLSLSLLPPSLPPSLSLSLSRSLSCTLCQLVCISLCICLPACLSTPLLIQRLSVYARTPCPVVDPKTAVES